jgi:hypothetical protein
MRNKLLMGPRYASRTYYCNNRKRKGHKTGKLVNDILEFFNLPSILNGYVVNAGWSPAPASCSMFAVPPH